MKPALAILGGFLHLSACSFAPLQSDALLLEHPPDLLSRVELSAVPFNSQQEYQCGPAALATLLQWNGTAVKAEDLTTQVYIPERKGSLQLELIATTRKFNLLPYVLDKDMTTLLREVQGGNPVLVLQNLGLDWLPQWHYAVVVGYDLEQDEIILRSGQFKRHVNSFALFEQTWRRAKYWAIVITAPDKIPVTATPLAYVTSVAAFEQLGKPEVAQQLYQSAIAQWPLDRNLLVAMGNTYYSQRDWSSAEAVYRKALLHHEDDAPALNNLANVLMEQGRLEEAEQYATAAISSAAGAFVKDYQETLREIRRRVLINDP